MFILWLLVNQCSVCVKQKSKTKAHGEKRHALYSAHSIYTLHQQQKVGLLLTIIYLRGSTGKCPI